MQMPRIKRGLKWATILTAIYGIVWISLEGDLRRVTVLAMAVALIGGGYFLDKLAGGRRRTLRQWLLLTAICGLFIGLGIGLLTLVLMAVKTGLHAHGPEFTLDEITWIASRTPLWGIAGIFAGLGLGLLSYQRFRIA